MESKATIQYEPPTITTYGTVRELTLGSGNSATPDISPCADGSHRATGPSGFSCKTAG